MGFRPPHCVGCCNLMVFLLLLLLLLLLPQGCDQAGHACRFPPYVTLWAGLRCWPVSLSLGLRPLHLGQSLDLVTALPPRFSNSLAVPEEVLEAVTLSRGSSRVARELGQPEPRGLGGDLQAAAATPASMRAPPSLKDVRHLWLAPLQVRLEPGSGVSVCGESLAETSARCLHLLHVVTQTVFTCHQFLHISSFRQS